MRVRCFIAKLTESSLSVDSVVLASTLDVRDGVDAMVAAAALPLLVAVYASPLSISSHSMDPGDGGGFPTLMCFAMWADNVRTFVLYTRANCHHTISD